LVLPDFRRVAVACFEFFLDVGKFRRAAEDSFDSSDGFDASLDCSRELQGVAVGGVVNDEDFHGWFRSLVFRFLASASVSMPKAFKVKVRTEANNEN
jgi:hypothetical protein